VAGSDNSGPTCGSSASTIVIAWASIRDQGRRRSRTAVNGAVGPTSGRRRSVQTDDTSCSRARIKVSLVASDILGAAERAIVEALICGENDPQALVRVPKRRLRQMLPALRRSSAAGAESQGVMAADRTAADSLGLKRAAAAPDFARQRSDRLVQVVEVERTWSPTTGGCAAVAATRRRLSPVVHSILVTAYHALK
jgi:hypothetical protein